MQTSASARVAADAGQRVIAAAEGLSTGAVNFLVGRAAAYLAGRGTLSLDRDERALAEAGVGGGIVIGPRVQAGAGCNNHQPNTQETENRGRSGHVSNEII